MVGRRVFDELNGERMRLHGNLPAPA